ncbi:carotenoid biosynthesis protein [Cesiribacter sp. SM1]|uniref:carotenoid biosynthesis protein n=1 Tax=Cesiribacter sp. SM1 TaxID=2861196 RepID=UPI001CD63545|nr:carotenoid biosynthesis protein [Cesiribacter sp. SM1]
MQRTIPSESLASAKRYAPLLLAASYAAGVVGLLLPQSRQLFQLLTPFHLLLTASILFWFHKGWSRQFILFCLVAFGVGYGVEVAGVHTGKIFGEYRYGGAFGFKIFEVPLLIGLNWLVLVYIAGVICAPLKWPAWARAGIAAALLIGLDVLMEPVSGTFDFWYWANDKIPLQNFVAWFATAYLLLLLFYLLPLQRQNRMALPLYIMQLLFFVSLLLFT